MAWTGRKRRVALPKPRPVVRAARDEQPAELPPLWDEELGELWYGGELVHRFERPAPIAKLILRVFQEQNWSRRIDDPLPPLESRRESMRLRNQIHALNRRLKNPLITFYMDGTGEGICWRPNPRPPAPDT